jgi:hypothetical protein
MHGNGFLGSQVAVVLWLPGRCNGLNSQPALVYEALFRSPVQGRAGAALVCVA